MRSQRIAPKYLPTRLPIGLTLAIVMAMKLYDASDLWRGVIMSYLVLLWIICLVAIATEKWVSPAEIDARQSAEPQAPRHSVRNN